MLTTAYMLRRLMARFRRALRSTLAYSLVVFLAVLFLGALAMYIVEHGHDPAFNSYFNALWFTMETITTVGYGDIVPNDAVGKVVDMVVMPVGIASISLLTASIASILMESTVAKSLGQHSTVKGGHLVVIGGVDRALEVISDVLRGLENGGVFLEVVYMANVDKPTGLPRDVEFIKGNPMNINDLRRAGVDRASRIAVLPYGDTDPDSDDAKVVLTIMNIRQLNQEAYVVAEVRNGSNTPNALRAGANMVISLGSLTSTAIATELIHGGVAGTVIELVKSGLYGRIRVIGGVGYVGRRFGELMGELRAREGLPVGILRNGSLILNPSDGEVVREGDAIVVIR